MAMRPTSNANLRRDLSEAAREYASELAELGMVADKVAPFKGVMRKSASYPIITADNFRKSNNDARKTDGSYNFIDAEFDSGNYECEERGLSITLNDDEAAEYEDFIDYEVESSEILTWQLMLRREKRIANMVFDTGTFTVNTVSTAWSNTSGATPVQDVKTGIRNISRKTGIPRSMMSLIIPGSDFDNLCETDDIKGQVQYTYQKNDGVIPANLSANDIAAIFGIKEVIVPELAEDIAPEGETASLSDIWTPGYAMLAVLASGENLSLRKMSAFRTMLWKKDSPKFPTVDRYRDDDKRSDILRVRGQTDPVITAEADLLTYFMDIDP